MKLISEFIYEQWVKPIVSSEKVMVRSFVGIRFGEFLEFDKRYANLNSMVRMMNGISFNI
jgi:hypothetical protein